MGLQGDQHTAGAEHADGSGGCSSAEGVEDDVIPTTSGRRVLEKAGMRFEGRMRDHLRLRGAWRDSLLYAAVHREVP